MEHAYGDYECKGCDSFAHDPSFTHDAIMDLCPSVCLVPRTFDLCEYSYHELSYLHGLDANNYPVPAVREWYEFAFALGPYDPGTDLFKSEVHLIHCYQGVVPCT